MIERIIGVVGLIAALITIFSFVGQVSESGFTGSLFDETSFRMPILNISHREAGIGALALVSVALFFVFKGSRVYVKGMAHIADRSHTDEGPDAVFIVLLLLRYPIGYFWAKAFWPTELLPIYATALLAAGAIFIIEFFCTIAYYTLKD